MDIAIEWDAERFRGDWNVTGGDLVSDVGGLRTAVLLSLFTDRVASPDYLPPPGQKFQRRGWWGDTYEIASGGSAIGSRLWQLNRAVKTDGTTLLAEARDYCREALQWLVDTGVVASVDVATFWLTRNAIGIRVTIAAPQSPPQVWDFAWAWQTAAAPQSGQQGAPTMIFLDARPSNATYLDANGNLVEVGPNVLRPLYLGGVLAGNLVEAAATNYVRNPRAEGAVAGTPGTLPTDWGVTLGGGLSQQIVGTGTDSGVPYVDIRVFGTATATGLAANIFLDILAATLTSASAWTLSAWIQVVAGATPNGQVELHFEEDGSGAVFPGTAISSPTTWTRYSETATADYPTDTSILGEVWVYVTSGDVVDFTLRIGAPQIEEGAAATSLILPPVGAPGVTTRAADVLYPSQA